MHKVIILIGLPGSGKSTYASHCEAHGYYVISPDRVRTAQFRCKGLEVDEDKVFEFCREEMYRCLGKCNIVYDATNMQRKTRRLVVEQIRKISKDVKIEYVVFAVPHLECIRRDSLREPTKRVGKSVIYTMLKNFQFPLYAEGVDNIQIHYGVGSLEIVKEVRRLLDKAEDFNQDNPHHMYSLDEHQRRAAIIYRELGGAKFEVELALSFHDYGKVITQTYKDTNGNVCDFAHYYRHENVSGYFAMFFVGSFVATPMESKVYMCELVAEHMLCHSISTWKKSTLRNKIMYYGEGFLTDLKDMAVCDDLA